MEKITFQLWNSDTQRTGYEVGNFIVYKGRYYWHIAHKTGATLLGDFKRRKDAVPCAKATDSPLWDFDDVGGEYFQAYQLELAQLWTKARNQCTTEDRFSSILIWKEAKGEHQSKDG